MVVVVLEYMPLPHREVIQYLDQSLLLVVGVVVIQLEQLVVQVVVVLHQPTQL